MKPLKTKLLAKSNAIIVAVIGFLGITSCKFTDPKPPAPEYGSPYATFELNGKVTSSATNEPIGNIRIVLEEYRKDTFYTKTDGTYQRDYKVFESGDYTFNVKYEDIDNTANGEFQSLDTVIQVKSTDFKDDSGDWNGGTATKEINVSLKPKE